MQYKYKPDGTVIPQSRREEINEKILYIINTGSNALPNEVIYNCYTGKGGLHGLDARDFKNYHDFSEAKKEEEMGQFFTPAGICEKAVSIMDIDPSEKVLDACCGMGGFFNFLPQEENASGFDIDQNALTVAAHLYPSAHLRRLDVRFWQPEKEERFDVILQNPPFNLEFKNERNEAVTSQMYIMMKSADALNTAGLIAVICPVSFLADTFWNRTDIEKVSSRFTFIGQTKLPDDCFRHVGVESYQTKMMVWALKSESITGKEYDGTFCSDLELLERVKAYRNERHETRLRLIRESASRDDDSVFTYELKKILFQIRAHPATKEKYRKAVDYYQQYLTQEPPQSATQEEYREWYNHKRITKAKVLTYCRRILTGQNPEKVRPGIRLVSDRKGIRFVSDTAQGKRTLEKAGAEPLSIRDMTFNGITPERWFPASLTAQASKEQLAAATRRAGRLQREWKIMNTPIGITPVPDNDARWLETFVFRNLSGEECRFTDLQKEDLGHLLQRPFSLINWQQGSGKTAALFAFGRYLLEHKATRTVFIVAPALAVNLTWIPFLKANAVDYAVLRKRTDVENIRAEGRFLVIPFSMMGTLYKPLRRLCRTISWKATLLFDESDELSNPSSIRTKSTLAAFRRLKHKMLATGTTTRNNIAEMYSQVELLYNNSRFMTCDCPTVFSFNKDGEIEENANDSYLNPFPAKAGHQLFRSCYCPGKTSVFGIKKFNQDIYNAESLKALCERTIVTRRFKEFAGEKYRIETVTVKPSENERAVYGKILNNLQELIPLYFSTQPDTRKAAALRIIRTLTLLIKACSVPNLMPGYNSSLLPTKTEKIKEMISRRDEKVILGTTTIEALAMYSDILADAFPERPLFIIDGSVEFRKRDNILKAFEATRNGILACTQQSLKSSVNIPTCNQVIIESLQWNIPKIQQFFFRTIRFDSRDLTTVHFVTYDETVEQNILGLLMTKQRLNEFVKTGEIQSEDDVLEEYGLAEDFLDTLLEKKYDEDGHVYFTWGEQKIA